MSKRYASDTFVNPRKFLRTPRGRVAAAKKTKRARTTAGTRSGIEWKYFDGAIETATPGSTWAQSETTLVNIGNNVTETGRVGRKVLVKSIELSGLLKFDIDTANSEYADSLRLVCVQDRQCNGAAAGTAEVFETDEIHALYNLDNQDRFKVLCDMRWNMGSGAGAGGSTGDLVSSRVFRKYMPVEIPVFYKGVAGTIADVASNNIFLYMCSVGGNIEADINWRLRFEDM